MPGRNTLKVDVDDSYYHIYARGHNKQKVFRDDEDFLFFIGLFRRHLSPKEVVDKSGRSYPHLWGDLELLAYCLMPNHFHMLVYQVEQASMSRLMRAIMTSYSCYFNRKYKKTGPLFETRYKASLIDSDEYLMHISRYIHLNPGDWQAYPYSSIHAYFGVGQEDWLQPGRIIELFGSAPVYADFLDDYVSYKKSLDKIKDELANLL